MTVSHTKNLTTNLRKKQGKEIKDLNKQNTKYREDYGLSIHGDREKLVSVLQSHPTLQLAYQNLNPKVSFISKYMYSWIKLSST